MSENTTESSLVLSAIRGLREECERRFSYLEERFEGFEKRTTPLNETLVNIDHSLLQLSAQVAVLHKNLSGLKQFAMEMMADHERRLSELEEKVH